LLAAGEAKRAEVAANPVAPGGFKLDLPAEVWASALGEEDLNRIYQNDPGRIARQQAANAERELRIQQEIADHEANRARNLASPEYQAKQAKIRAQNIEYWNKVADREAIARELNIAPTGASPYVPRPLQPNDQRSDQELLAFENETARMMGTRPRTVNEIKYDQMQKYKENLAAWERQYNPTAFASRTGGGGASVGPGAFASRTGGGGASVGPGAFASTQMQILATQSGEIDKMAIAQLNPHYLAKYKFAIQALGTRYPSRNENPAIYAEYIRSKYQIFQKYLQRPSNKTRGGKLLRKSRKGRKGKKSRRSRK